MRHLIVVCLAFMMGLNVACSRVEDLGKDDLHSEPTIEIVSGDTLDIVGFTLAHELATSEGRLPYNVGDEFGYTGSYTYKSYVVRTEYTYQDDGNSIWVWEDTLSSIIGFYPYLRSEVYDLADVQFLIRTLCSIFVISIIQERFFRRISGIITELHKNLSVIFRNQILYVATWGNQG